jgi:hypothetical protein
MYTCPFCQWPSISVTRDPAVDSMGNEFYHGRCRQCNCEVVFCRKPEAVLTRDGEELELA